MGKNRGIILASNGFGGPATKSNLLGRSLIPLKGEKMRKRSNEIKVRFTDEELAALDAKVAKTHLSRESFIRCILAEEEIYVRPDPGTKELIMQVMRVGNNLNQLLIHAQSMRFIDMPQLRKVTSALWECRLAIMDAYRRPGKQERTNNE